MGTGAEIGIAVGGVALFAFIIISWIIGTANGFNSKGQAVDAQWHQVETEYQRRLDLIPNLVAVAQGAQQQEIIVFGKIARFLRLLVAVSHSRSQQNSGHIPQRHLPLTFDRSPKYRVGVSHMIRLIAVLLGTVLVLATVSCGLVGATCEPSPALITLSPAAGIPELSSAAASADDLLVAYAFEQSGDGSRQGNVLVIDAANGNVKLRIPGDRALFEPDGHHLIVLDASDKTAGSTRVRRIDLSTFRDTAVTAVPGSYNLGFVAANGPWLALWGVDLDGALLDAATLALLGRFTLSSPSEAVRKILDDHTVLLQSSYPAGDTKPLALDVTSHERRPTELGWADYPANKAVVEAAGATWSVYLTGAGGEAASISTGDRSAARPTRCFDLGSGRADWQLFSAARLGAVVAVSGRTGRLLRLDESSGAWSGGWSLTGSAGHPVPPARAAPDGLTIFIPMDFGLVAVALEPTQERWRSLTTAPPESIAVSPDGKRVYAVADAGRHLYVLDAQSGRVLGLIAVPVLKWGFLFEILGR